MIKFLTTNPLAKAIGNVAAKLSGFSMKGDPGGLILRLSVGALAIALGLLFYENWSVYKEWKGEPKFGLEPDVVGGDAESLKAVPEAIPVLGQGIGAALAALAFILSFFVRKKEGRERVRGALIVLVLWIAAFGSLCAWLPSDVIATKAAISGKALAGENPLVGAYVGKLLLVGFLILSVPILSMYYYRLSLMDQYVVRTFLNPFALCLFGFVSIWIIAHLTDNGHYLATMSMGEVAKLYLSQIPFVIQFMMPIIMLLAGLSALSNLSRSNELISMVGSGRSVLRILTPVLFLGFYISVICLAFKYEWAPNAAGYEDAVIAKAKKAHRERQNPNVKRTNDLWAQLGWMHVNEVNNRTWFVGKVPFKLSEPMADVVVWEMDEDGGLRKVWKAERAKWSWDTSPQEWTLSEVTVFHYEDERFPRLESHESLVITDWGETPWKVLSSSQDPEYLGFAGLTMYLQAHDDKDEVSLAPFRTNFWYIFAEPIGCFVMLLVSAPLGIVYSRRGVMAGVTAAIIIFAGMYIMRGTLVAMGQSARISPVWGAWGTNLIIAILGVILLWFRARNREMPKLRNLFRRRSTA